MKKPKNNLKCPLCGGNLIATRSVPRVEWYYLKKDGTPRNRPYMYDSCSINQDYWNKEVDCEDCNEHFEFDSLYLKANIKG